MGARGGEEVITNWECRWFEIHILWNLLWHPSRWLWKREKLCRGGCYSFQVLIVDFVWRRSTCTGNE